jgi:hypothetical protein
MEIIIFIAVVVLLLLPEIFHSLDGIDGGGSSSGLSTTCRQCHGTGKRFTALGDSACGCEAGRRRP